MDTPELEYICDRTRRMLNTQYRGNSRDVEGDIDAAKHIVAIGIEAHRMSKVYPFVRVRIFNAAVNAHGGLGEGEAAADELMALLDRVFGYSK